MKNDFLIISFIGEDDKLGLMINKEFFIHNLDSKKIDKQIISDILNFLKYHNVELDKNFSVIINQGPGSFSSIRISLAVAKGLKISKKIQLFGYKNNDLKEFNQENVEKLVSKNLIEKKLIKPVYLS